MSTTENVVFYALMYVNCCCVGFSLFVEESKSDRITGRQLLALTLLSPITLPVLLVVSIWKFARYLYRICKRPVSAVLNFSFGSPMDAWNGMRTVVRSMLK